MRRQSILLACAALWAAVLLGTARAQVPGPLIEDWSHAFVPDPALPWHGAAAAAGVFVWAHGKGAPDHDSRGAKPPAYLRAFNDAGFDVVRFERAPMADNLTRAAAWLRDGLRTLRGLGYRRVIVGGQSRGAWNALQMLREPGLADTVIAVSPAAQGTGEHSDLPAQLDDLRRMFSGVPASATRVAFVQFAGDPFAADEDARATLVRGLLGGKGPLLVIDRPAGFSGHYAGGTAGFAGAFGACLARFATSAAAETACATP